MARIEVDYRRIDNLARQVENHINFQIRYTSLMRNYVGYLENYWKGTDYLVFSASVNELCSSGSTSGQMIRALENYKNFLLFSSNEYKKAQQNAIDRARNIR